MVLMAEGVRARSLPALPVSPPHLGHNTMAIGPCDGAAARVASSVVFAPNHAQVIWC